MGRGRSITLVGCVGVELGCVFIRWCGVGESEVHLSLVWWNWGVYSFGTGWGEIGMYLSVVWRS